jgi:hypothetical protein
MGWYGTMQHRRVDVIAAITKDHASESGTQTWKTLASCYRGGMRSGVLYSVMERAEAGNEPVKFIAVHLLKYYREDGWMYKPQDCCMGPYSTSCPESYLNMAPAHDGEHCKNFHERTRERINRRKLARLTKRAVMT